MIQASMGDAEWISKHTSGVGAGSPRGYGSQVPLTLISWNGVVEIAFLSSVVKRESSGTSVVQGTEVVSSAFHDTLTLVAPKPIEVQVGLVPEGGNGTIDSAGLKLGVIEQKVIQLFDLCGG